MTDDELALDQWLRAYWEADHRDPELASEIAGLALNEPPLRATTAARALQVIAEVADPNSAPLQVRVAEFRRHLEHLNVRRGQVDTLGDLGTPPEALFEILEPEVSQVELDGFDGVALSNIRIGAGSRVQAASALLNEFGLARLPDGLRTELQTAIADLSTDERFQAKAMFVDHEGHGIVLGLTVQVDEDQGHRWASTVDRTMAEQSATALDCVLGGQGTKSQIEWNLRFEGSSIGLAAAVAGLISGKRVPGLTADPLLAATGEVDVAGRVHRVAGIDAKIEAAARHGIRRVLLPEANRDEAAGANVDGIQLLFVSDVSEVPAALRQVAAASDLHFGGRVVFARSLLPAFRLQLKKEAELPSGHRLVVADGRSHANIDIYKGRKNSVVVSGPDGTAKSKAEHLRDAHLVVPEADIRPVEKFQIPTRMLQDSIHAGLLAVGGIDVSPNEHERWRVQLTTDLDQTTVVLWEKSGKLNILSTRDATASGVVRAALGPLVDDDDKLEAVTEAPVFNSGKPHAGTDESGKGDYFGPLVSAAVYVDAEIAARLADVGVKDSKQLSDRSVARIAADIRRLAQGCYAVTRIGPERFNVLLEEMRREKKNLNTLLAWGHARSIEDLLSRGVKPEFVIVDKFADVAYIESKILADTRESGLPIIQVTKAEEDIAVAAASILARDAFLRSLAQLSRELGIKLPKGASQQVIDAGREIVQRYGASKLTEVAKVGFATTEKVLTK